jgi:hypothetical protein
MVALPAISYQLSAVSFCNAPQAPLKLMADN